MHICIGVHSVCTITCAGEFTGSTAVSAIRWIKMHRELRINKIEVWQQAVFVSLCRILCMNKRWCINDGNWSIIVPTYLRNSIFLIIKYFGANSKDKWIHVHDIEPRIWSLMEHCLFFAERAFKGNSATWCSEYLHRIFATSYNTFAKFFSIWKMRDFFRKNGILKEESTRHFFIGNLEC